MKELKENKNITIKRADISNCYVIMNSEDYKKKLDNIVLHNSKFVQSKDQQNIQVK